MDTSSSDMARLVRLLAVRALVLALLVGIAGAAVPAVVFALVGIGLLLVPVGSAADRRPDRHAVREGIQAPQRTSSSTSAETASKRTGRLLIPVRRLE